MPANTQRKLQVFISSTFSDLILERQIAVSAILENGHIPAGMELFAAGDEEQLKVIRRWIDQSDIFLLLLGKRYGSIESKSKKSYTHLEYEYAIEKKIPFFAIVLSNNFIDAKIKYGETSEKVTEQTNPEKFKEFYELVTSKMCSFADDNKDIKLKIWQSIRDLESRYDFNGWVSSQHIPDNSSVLKEFASLTSKINLLEKEKQTLEETISKLEANKKKSDLYDGKTFEELHKLLSAKKVKLNPAGNKEVEVSLLVVLEKMSSYLVEGVTNSGTSSEFEHQLFARVGTQLAVYGIMQADKVPSNVHWKRFVLSDLGKRFLYELRVRVHSLQEMEKKTRKEETKKTVTKKKKGK